MKQDTTTLATFLYDADGNRVKGTVSGTTTVYIACIATQSRCRLDFSCKPKTRLLPCNRCNKLPLDNRLATSYHEEVKSYLNASEVARLLNVDRATVSRWIKKGLIEGVMRPKGSQQYRIPLTSCQQFVKNHENR